MADDDKINGAEAAPPRSLSGPVHIKLRTKIIANGEEVDELKFREPTAGDIERAGNPVILDVFSSELPKINFDPKAMTAMMSLLAAVPPSTIRMMHPKDWYTAAWQLAGFFTPDL